MTDLDKGGNPFEFVYQYDGPTIGWVKTTGTNPTSSGFVNAADFGVKGNGFNDDSFALQAAIDHALLFQIGTVVIPDGFVCVISRPIWMAYPGSYASVNPQTGGSFSSFQYSLALVGSEVLGNNQYCGVTIQAYGTTGGIIDFNKGSDYPSIIVGPGQGMRVAGLNILGAGGSLWPTTFSQYSIGIAISGGAGGASRTMVERVWVSNLRTGFKTGWNEDSLADSNTFIKCTADSCYTGFWFSQTQNYINAMYDCNTGCTRGVYSPVGKAVQVFGGNFSKASAIHVDFAISGTTGFTVTGGGQFVAFTTTITFGGDYFGFSKNGFTDDPALPIYNAFAVETTSFGVIPLSFSNFNPTTNAITLFFETSWWNFHFGFAPPMDVTKTDLQTEIQACTVLMASERITAFAGEGIHAHGPHFESPGSLFCMLDTTTLFNGDQYATIENPYFNWSPTTDAIASVLKMQSVFSVIYAPNAAGVKINGGAIDYAQGIATPPWMITTNGSVDFWFENFGLLSPNVQTTTVVIEENLVVHPTATRGSGHWDKTPFFPAKTNISWAGSDGIGIGWVQHNRGEYPSLGNVPAPGITPEITPAFYALISASPIVANKGTYPPISGRTIYRITHWDAEDDGASNVLAVSNHDAFSYGQNITVNWSYKGRSNCIYMDDTGWMFPGLKIGLDNGGGTIWYKIVGVYPNTGNYSSPRPGYITAIRVSGSQVDDGWGLTFGTKTVTYTGATVFQESYSLTAISRNLGAVLVSALPTPSNALKNVRALVTDATATTFLSTVAGSGGNTVPVFCDGTNWKIG